MSIYSEAISSNPETGTQDEEMLIPDSRARLTPAEVSERKLVSALNCGPIPVSHLQESLRLPRPH